MRPRQPSIMSLEVMALFPTKGWPAYREVYGNAPPPKLNTVQRLHLDWIKAYLTAELGADVWLTWNLRRRGAIEASLVDFTDSNLAKTAPDGLGRESPPPAERW